MNCIFCQKEASDILLENDLAKAFYDSFPVNQGHTLIVPKRHIATYFEATPEELSAIHELIFQTREKLQAELNPDGYNIGVNIGSAAGQTVFHLHFHLITRFRGDTEDPRGGVRKVKDNLVPYPPQEEKAYNKLVRDRIPEIIREAGKIPVCRTAGPEEYYALLKDKLREEVDEFLATDNQEELADVYEVMKALLEYRNVSWEKVVDLAFKKAEVRGEFMERVVLDKVISLEPNS